MSHLRAENLDGSFTLSAHQCPIPQTRAGGRSELIGRPLLAQDAKDAVRFEDPPLILAQVAQQKGRGRRTSMVRVTVDEGPQRRSRPTALAQAYESAGMTIPSLDGSRAVTLCGSLVDPHGSPTIARRLGDLTKEQQRRQRRIPGRDCRHPVRNGIRRPAVAKDCSGDRQVLGGAFRREFRQNRLHTLHRLATLAHRNRPVNEAACAVPVPHLKRHAASLKPLPDTGQDVHSSSEIAGLRQRSGVYLSGQLQSRFRRQLQ